MNYKVHINLVFAKVLVSSIVLAFYLQLQPTGMDPLLDLVMMYDFRPSFSPTTLDRLFFNSFA